MEGDLVIRLMGPVAMFESGGTAEITSARQRRLLAALAVSSPDVVSVDRLVDIVWAGTPPDSAPRTLQSYVSRLRSRLATAGSDDDGHVLYRAEPGYSLSASITSDASAFERLTADAHDALRAARFEEAAANLEEALGLWRGEPIAEFADEDWARPYAQRLTERRVTALEDLAECELGLGNPASAIARLEQLVAEHPLRERPRALLMRSLFAAGRQPEALRAYREFYSFLAEEVGLAPSPDLMALEAQITAGELSQNETAHTTVFGATERRLPTGTVTFLFTDIEDSTRLWEDHRDDMTAALARHDDILSEAIESHRGVVFSKAGDAFTVAFQDHDQAAAAAIEAQTALDREPWPEATPIRVRMGLHTGNAQERGGDYFGPTLNRAARIMSAAHGGQIIASEAFAAVAGTETMVDLGEHRLKDLRSAEHVWQVNAGSYPALRTLDVVRHNLSVVSEALVGRVDDVERVAELVRSNSLVSVLGPGGIGKTRVALEVAADLIPEFPDGVWFVDLAPVDVDAVGRAMLDTLGTMEKPGLTLDAALVEFCRSRRLLMVLDNCEHVLDPVADLVSTILTAAPDVRVLATTREAVRTRPEVLYPLRPLSGGATGDAATLFLERARSFDPIREWSDSDVRLVAEICERLDGMPLAIELAASRLRSLSMAELSERLEGSLRSLRGPRRGNERHRTIEATIRWSYDLLDDNEQRLFEHMAVFRGGAKLEAVQTVLASADRDEIEEVLDELIAKSMVQADTGGLATRYRLLEPLRQFAEDALRERGALDPVLDRHGVHFAGWAEDWMHDVWGPGRDLQARLDAEWANVRAAVDWAISQGSIDVASQLIRAMATAQMVWNRLEVGEWAQRALALPGIVGHPHGPELASVLCERLWLLNDVPAFEATLDRAWEMPHADPTKCWPAIHQAGRVCNISGDKAAASEIMDRIDPSDDRETAYVLWNQLAQGWPSSEHVDALDRLATASSSAVIATMAAGSRTGQAVQLGDPAASIESGRVAIAMAQALGSHFFTATTVLPLGCALGLARSTSPEDLEVLRSTLAEQVRLGQETDQWLILIGIAVAIHHLHDVPLAAAVQRALGPQSPWNDPAFLNAIPLCLPDVATQLDTEDEVLDRATLVNLAIDTLDDLISRAHGRPT